jgi:hypothetical protein
MIVKIRSCSDDVFDDQASSNSTMDTSHTAKVTKLQDFHNRLTKQEEFTAQMYDSMISEFRKLHSANKSQQSPPPQLYHHLNSHHHRQFQSTTSHNPHTPTSYDSHGHRFRRNMASDFQYHVDHPHHQEHSRRDDEWHSFDFAPKWHPLRADMPKFDGTSVIDWLENCEFFFEVTHNLHSKVQMVIPSLIGEAREWYRYYKLSNYELY